MECARLIYQSYSIIAARFSRALTVLRVELSVYAGALPYSRTAMAFLADIGNNIQLRTVPTEQRATEGGPQAALCANSNDYHRLMEETYAVPGFSFPD